MSVDAILEQAKALSPDELAELIERLQEAAGDTFVSPERGALLDVRAAAADANPNAGYTIEEVIAYVKRKK